MSSQRPDWSDAGRGRGKTVPGVYARLGVKPIINAGSWLTALGGSLMAPEVLRAMEEASTAFVDLRALQTAVGDVLARACGAEAGFVTGGAAASNVLMAAACMAGDDPSKIDRLPDSSGMKNEVVLFDGHGNHYDSNYEIAGATIVRWGSFDPSDSEDSRDSATVSIHDQLEEAFSDQTCAMAWIAAPFMRDPMPFKEAAGIAREHGIPVIVDAAAEVPPADNLTRFINEGADMVGYSGGKGIGGPQGSGMLVGREMLVAAAYENHLNSRGMRAGVGRSAKASKEDIVGLVTALQIFTDSDHEAVWAGWRAGAQYIVKRLGNINGLRIVLEDGDPNRQGPQAVIYFESDWAGPTPDEVRKALLAGDPPIHVGAGGYGDEINIVMVNVQSGEERIIADRLEEILAYEN
ncbi:MAG TPA: aminotransferase class V-fold PLP-dependent enzyme [Dehalococcoidia bacterium]|jgi:L-seryl-tRNA(Ser) seleniumtransferase|nr:aminotransferase class V-fold PLP-dependent enzyme [Dehalococcoidia bacterium]